ncbi:Anthranilate synthase component 1 [Roseivivax jejudonensis]|uniref:Anthranilate synthase n=1 Tax=Roseivivax jejudonensis TaxID=1529041 RepID=A0A1X6Z4J5_9RHOB|nr:anthranilate synthase component I [Roseivivax jejudonensis]SLN39831.1 Anthranilate synthase component 1 [Roseivivax jejudonensis]
MDHQTRFETVEIAAPGGRSLAVEARTGVAETGAFDRIIGELDEVMGLALASNYEYPSRYSIWNFGFTNPLLMLEARDRTLAIRAFSERGAGLLAFFRDVLDAADGITLDRTEPLRIEAHVDPLPDGAVIAEEDRTRKPSIFTAIRALWQAVQHPGLGDFGLYGAFGYDLIFGFDDIEMRMPRDDDQRDVVLFVPDRLFKSAVGSDLGVVVDFTFFYDDHRSEDHPRLDVPAPFAPARAGSNDISCDHAPGEYEAVVERARAEFLQGNLFEAVPGQCFSKPMSSSPAAVFRRLMKTNPSPFAFLMNLDGGEFLIGASPEMYVRTTGRTVETCPISGTIPRGADPLEDADQVLKLLSSSKDEAELTMCTDVDRNDKARICVPGSIEVRGRRQIEFYSRLIHTVDHVVGTLAEGYDGLDAFISHMWAVTVTGAPKTWAVRFLEREEKSPRRWYAGSIGGLMADGSLNTALSIRMVQVRDGIAHVRAGATTLYYSDPAAEERETRVKASAFLAALDAEPVATAAPALPRRAADGYEQRGLNVLMVDHEDSFVNTLGSYIRTFEPRLRTYRAAPARSMLDESIDLLVLSPGPGKPSDFDMTATLERAVALGVPVFGVCLGLQGVAEHFGGTLGVLNEPRHGVPTQVRHTGTGLFSGLPQDFDVARYHSLYAQADAVPDALEVTAHASDGVIMGLSHRALPIHTVQFHPESIITSKADMGMRLVRNLMDLVPARDSTRRRSTG